jgi:D-alanine transaminase
MSRIAYVNGRYIDHAQAHVHIEDRGYQFSDGIYEYVAFYNRKLLDGELHFKRLERSLKELQIAMPVTLAAMRIIVRELIERNGRDDGGIYIQVTRGVARRDHPFPKNIKPALVMTVCGAKTPKPSEMAYGVKVITAADQRWARRDIKSVSLLANILAKQEASRRQTREAWLLQSDGTITEGAASNAYIVSKNGVIVTHHADERILGGITRDVVLRLAGKAGFKVEERPFHTIEIGQAAEAFITSSSANVLPVVKIDDTAIGDGKPGTVTKALQELYAAHIFKQTGKQF